MKHVKKLSAAAGALIIAALLIPSSATAAKFDAAASNLAYNGSAVWHTKTNYHNHAATNGAISFKLNSHYIVSTGKANHCGGTINIGLRKAGASSQFSTTTSFFTGNHFALHRSGNYDFPGGDYSIISRSQNNGGCSNIGAIGWTGNIWM